VFTVPAELPANRVFRIAGTDEINDYGVRRAVAAIGILPLSPLLLAVQVARSRADRRVPPHLNSEASWRIC
jgi:hypothetical protein